MDTEKILADDIPSQWRYAAKSSNTHRKEYWPVDSSFNPALTYCSLRGSDGDFFVLGVVMGRSVLSESCETSSEGNELLIEFMQNYPVTDEE